MATYRSFDELNGKTLKRYDKVVFKVTSTRELVYVVTFAFLIAEGSSRNDRIFQELDLNGRLLAGHAYGYDLNRGLWPQSKNDDYEALTRLVLVLFAFSEGYDVSLLMPNKEWKLLRRDSIPLGPPTIKLDGYSTTVWSGEFITVGCQKIPFAAVERVYQEMKKLRK